MNFINEQHIVLFQRCEDAGEIPRLVQNRSGCDFKAHAEFVGNDAGKCGLA